MKILVGILFIIIGFEIGDIFKSLDETFKAYEEMMEDLL